MSARRSGLGRGLEALIPSEVRPGRLVELPQTQAPERTVDVHALVLRLRRRGPGLTYVYWCLEQVARDLDLEELVLVLEHEALGRQVFWPPSLRLGQLTIDQLRAAPGLHARPDRIDDSDAAAITALCGTAVDLELASVSA